MNRRTDNLLDEKRIAFGQLDDGSQDFGGHGLARKAVHHRSRVVAGKRRQWQLDGESLTLHGGVPADRARACLVSAQCENQQQWACRGRARQTH
jgi:hypothetical protein